MSQLAELIDRSISVWNEKDPEARLVEDRHALGARRRHVL